MQNCSESRIADRKSVAAALLANRQQQRDTSKGAVSIFRRGTARDVLAVDSVSIFSCFLFSIRPKSMRELLRASKQRYLVKFYMKKREGSSPTNQSSTVPSAFEVESRMSVG
eukprot:gb/GECG01010976.1/.p1 GENE.gb/GECG01010976.1/~~gb/GECG01010976.1/.p1  ORF type:complete len:112 (+),score=11.47 gb/GECG01010976.1/:1-336(+)